MSYGLWSVVIFLTGAAGMLGTALWMTRNRETAAPPVPPVPVELEPQYAPFPVDTGPLPLLSELSAGWDALEREQRGWSA